MQTSGPSNGPALPLKAIIRYGWPASFISSFLPRLSPEAISSVTLSG